MIRPALLLLVLAAPAYAAGPVDPDWPCVQRRQPQLSVAQVWAGPPADAAAEALLADPAVQDLAQVLALRRTALPEAEARIADFAADHDAAALTALFLATFDHIQTRRNQVMAGITRYAHKQAALDNQIATARQTYDQLLAASPQDFDAIDKAEAEIDWSTRIFQDRQQSLTYVCETPVILEQRAFAIGRAIAAHLKE